MFFPQPGEAVFGLCSAHVDGCRLRRGRWAKEQGNGREDGTHHCDGLGLQESRTCHGALRKPVAQQPAAVEFGGEAGRDEPRVSGPLDQVPERLVDGQSIGEDVLQREQGMRDSDGGELVPVVGVPDELAGCFQRAHDIHRRALG